MSSLTGIETGPASTIPTKSMKSHHDRMMKTGAKAKAKEHVSAVAECRGGDNNVDEDEHDKFPPSVVADSMPGRWRKGRVGTMACGKRVARMKHAHLAKYHAGLQGHGRAAPTTQKRSVGQIRGHHTPRHHSEQQQHKALCNVGSGTSHRSEAVQSTNAPMCVPVAGGPTNDQAPRMMKDSPPDVPIQLSSGVSVELITKAPNSQNGNTPQNNVVAHHGTQQQQCRRTIAVSTSEEHATTDESDSEWASEDMGAGEKNSGMQKQEQQCHDGDLGNGSCHGNSAGKLSTAANEARVRTAFEVQRQREFFVKVPKQSYSNLNTTRQSSLTQLLNTNPALCSSGRLHETTRPSQSIATMNLTMTQSEVQVQGQPFCTIPPQKTYDAFAAPPTYLLSKKNTVALAMATQVTVISRSKTSRNEKTNHGYHPKSPPREEIEDGSEEGNEDQCLSKSIALEKLQAFMWQQTFSERWKQRWKLEDDGMKVHGNDHSDETVAHTSGVQETTTNTAAIVARMQIPPGHPYNLPPPVPPTTPSTTRRRMLSTELSESMRRQLLWERQVSNPTNPTKAFRRETGNDEF
ncbi:hypothetical protein EDD15DRAFT_2376200 [Pisolithus albus]|nr:hypothetical protein EDD15DRAFT_2376200 [Pisolithus albus]